MIPVNTTPPYVSGAYAVSQELTATPGVWDNEPTTVTRQWYANSDPIAGATGIKLMLTEAEFGKTIYIEEVAENADGNDIAGSEPGGPVLSETPEIVEYPVTTGDPRVGETLSVSDGTWDRPATQPLVYSWSNDNGPIAGANQNTYVVQSSDVGMIVFGSVELYYGTTSRTYGSDGVGPITSDAPFITTLPSVAGQAKSEQTLTATPGVWGNNPTSVTGQWFADNVAIPGATGLTLDLGFTNVSKFIRYKETATNENGSVTAESDNIGPVESRMDYTARPVLSTMAGPNAPIHVGGYISCSRGTWNEEPISYAYSWELDGEPTSETGQAFVVPEAWLGLSVVGIVTATSGQGEVVTTRTDPSDPVLEPVEGSAPVNTGVPTVSGEPVVGQTLNGTQGDWDFSGGVPNGAAAEWKAGATSLKQQNMFEDPNLVLVVPPEAEGETITLSITFINASGYNTATSLPTAVVTGEASGPVNTTPCVIVGPGRVGRTLTITPGVWNEGGEFSYKWKLDGVDAPGNQGAEYVLTMDDLDKVVSVEETIVGESGTSTTASSNSIGPVGPALVPAVITAPSISGGTAPYDDSAFVGDTLTANVGTWTNNPTSFNYRWMDMDRGGVEIGVANQPYTISKDDISGQGVTIGLWVTAENEDGEETDSSAELTVMERFANVVEPEITGDKWNGGVVAVSEGEWTDTPDSITYQWYSGGEVMPGRTENTFPIDGTQVGTYFTVVVTAKLGEETAPVTVGFNTIEAPKTGPVNNSPPVISGNPVVGQTLNTTNGDWTVEALPDPRFFYWYADDEIVATYTEFGEEKPLLLTEAMLGKNIHLVAVMTDENGTTTVASNILGPVTAYVPEIPVCTQDPQLNGTPRIGETLTVTPGIWSESGTIGYQWISGGNAFHGGTETTLVLTAEHLNTTITVKEFCTNEAGTGESQASNAVGPVIYNAPVNTTAPAITGDPRIGNELAVSDGVWTNVPTAFTYLWKNYNTDAPLGNNSNRLSLVGVPVGTVIACVVTATNTAGDSAMYATGNATVYDPTPVNTAPPVLSGQAFVGDTLATTNGTWDKPAGTYVYSWFADDQPIANNTNTLALTQTHVGKSIRVEVIYTVDGASATHTSNSLGPVRVRGPVMTVRPTITGEPRVGQVLTGVAGTWTGDGQISYVYSWLADGAVIAGVTGLTFTPAVAQQGKVITFNVKATDVTGETTGTSIATSPVAEAYPAAGTIIGTTCVGKDKYNLIADGAGSSTQELLEENSVDCGFVAAPVNSTLPAITGEAKVNKILTASAGTWTGQAPITYALRWTANGQVIPGATATTLMLTAAHLGMRIGVISTATNTGGSSEASSAETEEVEPADGVHPAAGTILAEFCDTATQVVIRADGQGGEIREETEDHADCVGNTDTVPVNATPPSIIGDGVEGSQLAAVDGVWNGTVVSRSLQWYMDGEPVGDATARQFTLNASMIGKSITVAERVENMAGWAQEFASNPIEAVRGAPPVCEADPIIDALEWKVGVLVESDPGDWTGSPTFAYQWLADGVAISGATTAGFTPTAAQIGKKLSLRVTGTNAFGNDVVVSNESPAIVTDVVPLEPPVNTVAPTITGTAEVSQVLTATTGTWTGKTPITTAMQWFAGGVAISGATGTTLTLTTVHKGKRIVVVVTATNADGSTPANSAPTLPVIEDTDFLPAGTVISTRCEGSTLVSTIANGQGGTYETNKRQQEECGYVPFPEGEVDDLIEQYKDSDNATLRALAKILGCYRNTMGFSKPCTAETIHDLQLQLWAGVRAAVFEDVAFRDCMDFILAVFKENRDGAFELTMVMRTVDMVGTRLTGDQREAYIGMMNIFTWAGQLHDKSEVKTKVDLERAVSSKIFSQEARLRLIGYFDA